MAAEASGFSSIDWRIAASICSNVRAGLRAPGAGSTAPRRQQQHDRQRPQAPLVARGGSSARGGAAAPRGDRAARAGQRAAAVARGCGSAGDPSRTTVQRHSLHRRHPDREGRAGKTKRRAGSRLAIGSTRRMTCLSVPLRRARASSPRWIDTHCHLDAAEFDADREAVVARARQPASARRASRRRRRPTSSAVRSSRTGTALLRARHPSAVHRRRGDDDLARCAKRSRATPTTRAWSRSARSASTTSCRASIPSGRSASSWRSCSWRATSGCR